MANYTFTSDTNLCDFIDSTSAYDPTDNIFINSGAIITIDRSPSGALGNITIDDGILLIDGANATNPIHVWGQRQRNITPAGSGGKFESTVGWYTHPTTGTGLANQTLDMTNYWTAAGGAGDFVDYALNGLWMEDTVEVSFNNVTSTVDPEIGDWVELQNDRKIHGKVRGIDVSAGTIQIEGFPQTIQIGDVLSIIKEVDDQGAQLKETWYATVTSGETLITDKWMKMARLNKHSDDSAPTRVTAKNGQGFTQTRLSTTITFPFKVPRSGARFRFPMITMGTVENASGFNSGTAHWESQENNRYDFNGANAGTSIARGINFGSAYYGVNSMGQYIMEECCVSGAFGNGVGTQSRSTNSIWAADFSDATIKGGRANCLDCLSGMVLDDCLWWISSGQSNGVMFAQNSDDIIITDCVIINDYGTTTTHLGIRLSTTNRATVTGCEIGGGLLFQRVSDFTVRNNRVNLSPLFDSEEMANVNVRNISFTGGCFNGVVKAIRFDSTSKEQVVYQSDSFNIKFRAIGSPDYLIPNGTNRRVHAITMTGAYGDMDIARFYMEQNTGFSNANGAKIIKASRTGRSVTLRNIHGSYTGEIEVECNLQNWQGFTGGEDGGVNTTDGMETDLTNIYGKNSVDFFTSATTGNIGLAFREPSSLDGSINNITITGDYYWDRRGKLGLYAGSVAEFDTGYFALGHTGFTGNVTIGIGQTSNKGVNALANGRTLDFQYDLNDGNGFNGTWLDADTPANLTGITINPANGIRMKFRLSNNGSTKEEFNGLLVETTTTATAQQTLYPIDQNFVPFVLTNLQPNSEIRVYLTGTANELFGVENSGTTFTNQYLHTGSDFGVDIIIHNNQYEHIRLTNVVLSTSAVSIPIQQQFDRQYNNP